MYMRNQLLSRLGIDPAALMDYGVIGLFCLLLIAVVRELWRINNRKEEETRRKLAALEEEFRAYQIGDRAAMMAALTENAAAMRACTTALEELAGSTRPRPADT